MAVRVVDRQDRVAISRPRLARASQTALAAVGRPASEVEILVVDDAEIARLNGRYLGRHRRTDVLAFPLEVSDVGGGLLGQVVISAQTARRQARQVGVPVLLEMDLLVTHGILHLVGYDDRDPVEAELMHGREREILASARTVPRRLWAGLLHD
jgi:probable rRNA maturation factor